MKSICTAWKIKTDTTTSIILRNSDKGECLCYSSSQDD